MLILHTRCILCQQISAMYMQKANAGPTLIQHLVKIIPLMFLDNLKTLIIKTFIGTVIITTTASPGVRADPP